jgi:hypothetical protein
MNGVRQILILLAATFLLLVSACTWKPPCPIATITEPWERMNLPINKDAAICLSTATKFQAAHKADRETVTKMYLDSLLNNGWKLTARDLSATYHFDFERGTESITLEVYEWQKTGVLLKKR